MTKLKGLIKAGAKLDRQFYILEKVDMYFAPRANRQAFICQIWSMGHPLDSPRYCTCLGRVSVNAQTDILCP